MDEVFRIRIHLKKDKEFWKWIVLLNAFTSLTYENVLPLFSDLFEAMNNAMAYYE